MRSASVWLSILLVSACGYVGIDENLDAGPDVDSPSDASTDTMSDAGPVSVAPGDVRIISTSDDGSPFSATEWSSQNGGDISARARFVAFNSALTSIVTGDTNGETDVFVMDTTANSVERIDFTLGGEEPNGESYVGAISPDGRYVVMGTTATRFVPGDVDSLADVVIADRDARSVETISVSSSGELGNGNSNVRFTGAVLSNDTRFVVFTSSATNLGGTGAVGGRTENAFVRDRLLGTTTCLSCLDGGEGAAQGADDVMIAGDGQFAFFSSSSDVFLGDDAGFTSSAIFRRDLATDELLLVSRGLSGDAEGEFGEWSTTDDGSLVAFLGDRAPGMGWASLIFDPASGMTQLVSLDESDVEVRTNTTVNGPHLSPDGRYLAFPSGGTRFRENLFVRNLESGRVSAAGQRADGTDRDGFYFTLVFDPTSTVILVGTDEALSSVDSNDAGDLYLRGLPL